MSDRIGLADYLTNLRAELSEAQSRASGDPLKLGVDQITVSLDIGCTITRTGEASAGLKAKFWVLEVGEAGVKGSQASARIDTQHLTLTLKPRLEEVLTDQAGRTISRTRGVDVAGEFTADEERPSL